VTLAYFRPYIFKFAFGISYEYQTIKLNDVLTPERFSFILISVIIHHFTLFILEAFQVSFFWDILIRTLLSTVFTIISCIIIIYLIKPNKRWNSCCLLYHQTLLLLIRIFYLQVINDSFKLKSDNNAIKIKYTLKEAIFLIDMESFWIKHHMIWWS
jgi:hypothetical protein